jgi:Tfp pilus assembly protein PilF
MDAKEFEQALAVLASAEVAFPQSYPFMERIGVCYYQKGEKQKGLSLLEQAYALYPNKKLAQTLFEYLANEGQIEKANTYKAAAQQ